MFFTQSYDRENGIFYQSITDKKVLKKWRINITYFNNKRYYLMAWTKMTLPALACNFIKKESLTQVFSCEFCEISKNTFFYGTPPVAASKTKELVEQILFNYVHIIVEGFSHCYDYFLRFSGFPDLFGKVFARVMKIKEFNWFL